MHCRASPSRLSNLNGLLESSNINPLGQDYLWVVGTRLEVRGMGLCTAVMLNSSLLQQSVTEREIKGQGISCLSAMAFDATYLVTYSVSHNTDMRKLKWSNAAFSLCKAYHLPFLSIARWS